LTMNLLAADLNSPRSVTVWVMPSALYALASDRLIAVVRRWVLFGESRAEAVEPGSPWQALGGLALWLLRLALDLPGTVAGFRRWVLGVAPVAPGTRAELSTAGSQLALPASDQAATANGGRDDDTERPAGLTDEEQRNSSTGQPIDEPSRGELAPGETKRHALIRLYERYGESGDPRFGDRTKTAQLAGEIAGRIGYHPGTARRELAKYLAGRKSAVHSLEETAPDAEEAA
jgi:hypothetical protein